MTTPNTRSAAREGARARPRPLAGGAVTPGAGLPMAVVATALIALSLTLPSAARAQYPTRPPAAAPLRPVRFPPFVTGRLANGLDYIVVAQHRQPVVSVSLAVPAGNRYDPADKSGLAGLVSDLLTKGTASRTAEQIAAEVEGAGGAIGASAGDDFISIDATSLAENFPALLTVLADVVTGSGFPAGEVDLTRTRALSALQVQLSQPGAIAQRVFGREVYGEHPYGRSATPASLRAITRDDVVRFYQERVKPSGALLVVAGDVDPARVRELAAAAFASWTGAPAAAAEPPAPPTRTATEVVLVHKPGAVQSNIVAGFTFITPRDPQFYALTVMDRVLGGGGDSRLFLILREQHGWTYGAYSGFSRPRGVGAFQATAEVRTAVTDSSVAEIARQLIRIRTEITPDTEFAAAKNYLVGSFPLSIETPERIAGAVARARLLGLPDDYVIRYRDRLALVTRAQALAAARRRITPDRMAIVVVGDGPALLAPLRALGYSLRIVDVEGRPLTEADLTPRASGVAWVRERLQPFNVRYRVMVQGNPMGDVARSLERVTVGGREVLRSSGTSDIGTMMHQADTTLIDAGTLAPISTRMSGSAGGQELLVRLDYEGGRVRGQVRMPGPGGTRDAQVDTTLAAGVLDQTEISVLLGALPLAAGGRWTFTLFSASGGSAEAVTAAVTGEESVTVPAGTFPCWRVEMTGGDAPLTFYVMKDAPWLVAKYEMVGMPVAFELTARR